MSDAQYAYHEAGHAVAAAVLGFPFRSSGIHIDRNGLGVTHIVCPSRKCSSPFSDLQASQTRMIIVHFAGPLAQKNFCSDSLSNSAADDELKINQYLGAIYRTDETSALIARNYLKQEAERLVQVFRDSIKKVAETLWAKDCTPVTDEWSTKLPLEKTVATSVIAEILKKWNISCEVDDCTIEAEPPTVAD